MKLIVSRLLILGTIVLAFFSVTGYLGKINLYFELTSHFRLQYLVLAACAIPPLLLLRVKKPWLAVCAFCLVVNLAEILPWYLPQPNITSASSAEAKPLRVLLANVLSSNQRYPEVISLIRAEKPDLAVFIEINTAWSRALEQIQDILPNAVVHPREDNFGIAIYSKLPLQDATAKAFGLKNSVSILANIAVKEQKLSIVATHPVPPIGNTLFSKRNQHLAELASYIQQQQNPTIAIGDFNTTMWSPHYKSFVRTTGLRNGRSGFGIQPTWPTQLPLLSIPLDHCLVSPSVHAVESRTGPNIGSDHLPLITDLAIEN